MKHAVMFVLVTASLGLLLAASGVDPALGRDGPAFSVYGYIQGDAIYDFKRVYPAWNTTLRPSQIPITYEDDGTPFYDEGEFLFNFKSSRIGTRMVQATDSHAIHAQLEIDFWGTGTNAGQALPRLRQAWASYGQLLMGQTWSLFSSQDIFPMQTDFWGPCGIMASRRPQIRWTPAENDRRWFAIALEQPGAGVDMGRGPQFDPTFDARSRSVMADLTMVYRSKRDWGYIQLAGVARNLGWEGTVDGVDVQGSVFGWGGNLTGRWFTTGRDGFLGQIAYGEGVANYVNDGGFDLAGDGIDSAMALPLTAWYLGYEAWWSERWSSTAAGSQTIQDNSPSQLDLIFQRGTYVVLNLMYHPQPQLMYGMDFLWGERRNKDGRTNTDYRLQFSCHYRF